MCRLCGLGRRRPSNPFPAPPSKPQDQNASGAATMEVGPYTKVDTHLRGLAHAAEGFGHSAKGGLDGEIYHVTSLAGQYNLFSFSVILVKREKTHAVL